jgi:hypothetical protein
LNAAHPHDQLSAYLDGELSSEERAQVDAHLAGCSACGAQLAELAAVDALAREMPVEAPAGYFEALPARIRARVPPRRRATLPAWAMLVAASLLVAVIAPVVMQQLTRARAPLPASAPAPEVLAPPAAKDDSAGTTAPAPPPATPAPGTDADTGLAETLSKREAAPKLRRDEESARERSPGVAQNEAAFASPPQDAPRPQAPAPATVGRTAAAEEDKKSGEGEAPPLEDERRQVPQAAEMAEAQGAAGVRAKAGPPARDGEAYDEVSPNKASDAAAKPQAKRGLTATGEAQLRALTRQVPQTAAQARALREKWRQVAETEPGGAGDEARVRVVELGAEAFRLAQDPADRERALSDARAYLARPDAAQRARVSRVWERLSASPSPR